MRRWIPALVLRLVPIFFLIVFIRITCISLYHVPTGSMEPTLLVGDRFMVLQAPMWGGVPERDAIVVFDDPQFTYDARWWVRLWQRYCGIPLPSLSLPAGPALFVKRVIGVPGDTLEGRIVAGMPVLVRNGESLCEPYLNRQSLITLRKNIGLIPADSICSSYLPAPLVQHERIVRYAYDRSLSFEAQPYYRMTPEECVLHPFTNAPLIENACQYYCPTPSDSLFSSLSKTAASGVRGSDVSSQYYDRTSEGGEAVDRFDELTVPPGMYWVAGDTRVVSNDSRHWGFVPALAVRGTAWRIAFSCDSEEPLLLISLLRNPWKFFTEQIRYGRTGKRL